MFQIYLFFTCSGQYIGDSLIYLILYVDDVLLIGNEKEFIHDVKNQLSYKFDINDIGAANFILGMESRRD